MFLANIIGTTYSIFTYFAVGLLVLIGLLLIGITIYGAIKSVRFKKNGVLVYTEVKKVKEIKDDEGIVTGYDVTFAFEYNGHQEETISCSKRFKVGSKHDALFLPNDKLVRLSVKQEGFYVAKGGNVAIISFALFLFFLAAYIILDFSTKILIYTVLIYFIALFLFIGIMNRQGGKNNEKGEIYNTPSEDEFSSVDKSLIRYKPKNTYVRKQESSFSLLSLIFIGLGGILVFGVTSSLLQLYNNRENYEVVIGEISKINYYSTDDSDDEYMIELVYTYEVNGEKYKLEYPTGKNKEYFSYEIGEKEEIYYSKNNPNDAFPKSTSKIIIVMLMVGLLFMYYGIYFVIHSKRKQKIYDIYIMLEDESV